MGVWTARSSARRAVVWGLALVGCGAGNAIDVSADIALDVSVDIASDVGADIASDASSDVAADSEASVDAVVPTDGAAGTDGDSAPDALADIAADIAADVAADSAAEADADAAEVVSSSEWLEVRGNHITFADGTRFHGRGANLHDERSCSACSFAPRSPDGVNRWADELIDGWHANFVRFLLSAKSAPYNEYEQQWQSLSDDADYLADVAANVAHMSAKPGVYILLTLFADPTIKENNSDFDSEWPSSAGDTLPRYRLLAETFVDNPRVLFGLTNEPHTTRARAPELAQRYVDAIAAIRAVEDAHGRPHHIIVVQAPEGWSRDLTYFVEHPLAGDNIAYEIHPYNPQSDFASLITGPAATLPILIGEYGPAYMDDGDIRALWTLAQSLEIPYLAWNFHQRCPPNLLADTASDGCGLDVATGYDFPRTAWGDLLFEHLSTPW